MDSDHYQVQEDPTSTAAGATTVMTTDAASSATPAVDEPTAE